MQVDGGLIASAGEDPVVALRICYSGPHARADSLFAPIRKAGKLETEKVEAMDYVLLQKIGDITDPRAMGNYLKSGFTGVMTPDLIDDIVDGFEPDPGRRTAVVFQQSGGAIGRHAQDSTAFANRDSKHNMLCNVRWKMGSDATDHIAYIRQYWDSNLESHIRGFYTNDLFDETQGMVNSNYRNNYDRLVTIKNQYDPENLFRLNANVKPTV